MTLNELSILKNAVLDATESYVDEMLKAENLPFSRTEIGVVIENTVKDGGDRTLHKVRVGTTTRFKTYKNILSIGNIEYPVNSVVFLIIPSGQQSNGFIVGKLDTSPANIEGGQIHIGLIAGTNPKQFYFNVDNQGNVEILKGSIKLNYDSNLGDYSFIVDDYGIKSGLYSSLKKWYFTLDKNGNVEMLKGSIKLGYNETIKDYSFIVNSDGIKSGIYSTQTIAKDWKFKVDTKTGDVTIRSGSIVLGGVTTDSNGLTTTGVKIDPNNGLSMSKGSIKLGAIGSQYAFEATSGGDIICKKNVNNVATEVFSVRSGAVYVGGYLEDGAFSGNTRTNRTKIDGSHIETGFIRSTNLALKDAIQLSDYNGKFTDAGTIIDLDGGFISSKKFFIDKDGNTQFKGELVSPSGNIGVWKINSNGLSASVSNKEAFFNGGKMHLLGIVSSNWRQVCFNPAVNKAYLSGMELFIDNNAGDLNGDTHENGSNFVKISSNTLTVHDGTGDHYAVVTRGSGASDASATKYILHTYKKDTNEVIGTTVIALSTV